MNVCLPRQTRKKPSPEEGFEHGMGPVRPPSYVPVSENCSRSFRFRILPEALRGRSSTKCTFFGTLKGASRSLDH